MSENRMTGDHEESARATLAQRAADGVRVPASLASLLVDTARRLDEVPRSEDPNALYAFVKAGVLLLSTEKRIASLTPPEVPRPTPNIEDLLAPRDD